MNETTLPTASNPLPPFVDGQAEPAERDGKGRFVKGWRGGPGNPFARKVAGLRSAFLAAASDEDAKAIAQKLLDMAKAGDLAATELWLKYTVGKPPDSVNPDHLDLDELALLKSGPDCDHITHGLSTLPLPAAVVVARVIQELIAKTSLDDGLFLRPEVTKALDEAGLGEFVGPEARRQQRMAERRAAKASGNPR